MKKSIYLSIVIYVAQLSTLLAVMPNGTYMIGAYSEMRSHQSNAYNDSLAAQLSLAGFNATRGIAVYNNSTSRVTDMANTIGNPYNLNLILEDFIFNPNLTNNSYGYAALAAGNFQRYEAEYDTHLPVNTSNVGAGGIKDEHHYYKSIDRVGLKVQDNLYHNNYYWHVPCDSSGYAFKDIYLRWEENSRLRDEFRFLRTRDFGTNPNETNKLYIKFVFKVQDNPNNPIAATDTLATFSFTYYLPNSQYGAIVPFDYNNNENLNYFRLTKGEYDNLASAGNPYDSTIKQITFQVIISDITSLMVDKGWFTHLTNLNPRMFWYGKGSLNLDCIEFFDDIFETYTNISSEREKLREFSDVTNLIHFYGVEEPKAPHFESAKLLEAHLRNSSRHFVAALNMINYKYNSTLKYRNTLAYCDIVNPRTIMIDRYSFTGGLVDWSDGDSTHSLSIQRRLNVVTGEYNYYREACKDLLIDLVMIPQLYGQYNASESKWDYLLPPSKMARCLQLLPLCYQADGIFSFLLGSEESNKFGLINYTVASGNITNVVHSPLFDEVRAANLKIMEYAPLLLKCTWIGASDIVENEVSFFNSTSMLDGIKVSADDYLNLYKGHIECALYQDESLNPLFMAVNRRTTYVSTGFLDHISPASYHASYSDAPPQDLCFNLSNSATSHFGTHIALYDKYDNSLYRQTGDSIRVSIGPGDGKLLQMCSTLPSSVTSNATIKNLAYLTGSITIDSGANVTIQNQTKTTVFPHTVIRVKGGSSFNLSGEVSILDSVTIIVEEGSSIQFNNAICKWRQGSILMVNGSTLSITSSSLDTLKIGMSNIKWKGVRVSNSSLVTINDATLSNAEYYQVSNSDLLIYNSKFKITANSWGLLLKNSTPGYLTEIINTEPGRGFFGESNLSSKGIYLSSMMNPVVISNTIFQNLYYGVYKCSVSYANDTISDSRFINCNTGIRLYNNSYRTAINDCFFVNNQTGKQWTGIQLVASSPSISNSNFQNLYRGILTEFALNGEYVMESSISESNFSNCEMGIESRSANHRLQSNYFNQNYSGIVNHAGSNLNLSSNANNVFMNRDNNIVFYDTVPYMSTIQLFVGHNDFYRLTDNGTNVSAVDFNFDTNYYDFPVTQDHRIDASRNWFQDSQVICNDPNYMDYIYVDMYDPSPSMPAPLPVSDRLFLALDYESQGIYDLAGSMYKSIIDEHLESESAYLTSAIDGLYRCTSMIPNPSWELTNYFDTKALQYAIDDPSLSAILKDYLAKVFVLYKDFQAAVDLIQLRIDNPISEIDSLIAVLDLEIVLQLAAMEEDKRPLSTKYIQYQYPDIQVFDVMHGNNWEKYNRLIHQNDSGTVSMIAPVPQIQSNYPNPFNPSTTIAFSIPEAGRVRVSVYNIKGQKVNDLINAEMLRGNHKLTWDGKDANNRIVGSGIYLLKLESGGKTSVRKAMLMK